MVLRAFKPVLTLRTNNEAHTSLTSPHSLLVNRRVWATSPLVVAVRCIFWFFFFFFCPVLMPSEIPKFPTDMPVRVSYCLSTCPPSWLPPQNGSLSLISFASIFIFYTLFYLFWRDWTSFLGDWCPLPEFRSCFVEVSRHSHDLLMNL